MNKKIKLNQKLPSDYIELIKKRSNWIKKIKSNQKLQWLNFATNGQLYFFLSSDNLLTGYEELSY